MKAIKCTCCGTELDYPQFHNGWPYGSTCIQRFNVKPVKNPGLWVVADKTEVFEDEKTGQTKVRAYLGKRKFADVMFDRVIDKEGNTIKESNYIQGGLIKVAKYKNGSTPIWKRLIIITEHTTKNNRSKLTPISLFDERNNETILTF